MQQTKKQRQGPIESATLFSIGTIKKGNDGNKWVIIETSAGIHRWKQVKTGKPSKTSNNKTHKKPIKSPKKTPEDKPTGSSHNGDASQALLVSIAKKNQVTSSGTKKELAEKIWRVRSSALDSKDLEKILGLLSNQSKKEVNKLLAKRIEHPILNYRGMWKKQVKPLNEMSRTELLKDIRKFRDVWEEITTRNQDLGDDRLVDETDNELREHLKYYYSNSGRLQAEDYLRDM
jgi:DNA-binding transcriptional ArsR family regulator